MSFVIECHCVEGVDARERERAMSVIDGNDFAKWARRSDVRRSANIFNTTTNKTLSDSTSELYSNAYLVHLAVGAIADHFDELENASRILGAEEAEEREEKSEISTQPIAEIC